MPYRVSFCYLFFFFLRVCVELWSWGSHKILDSDIIVHISQNF